MIKYSELVRHRDKYISYLGIKRYRLEEDLIYWIDYEHQNEYVFIPAGYEFDFNSSPCFAHCLVDRDQFMIAVIHDMLYSRGGQVVVIDDEDLSPKFKEIAEGRGFGYEAATDRDEEYPNKAYFLYNRKFADKVWLWGAIEESREIERVDRSWQAYIGYLGIRIGGSSNFRK